MFHIMNVVHFLAQSSSTYSSSSSTVSDEASAAALAGFFGLFGAFWIIWAILFFGIMALNIAGVVFWIMMILDAAKREFPNPNDKTLWILVLVFTSWIGALVYYFVVKKKHDEQHHSN